MAGHGGRYEIRVSPGFGPRVAGAIDGVDVIDPCTLRSSVPDQAALHALFDRIHDFGLDIIEVRLIEQ